jgi:hypothetical protein
MSHIIGRVYMVMYHHNDREDWRIVDNVVATSPECANDFAIARCPEAYHLEQIFEDTEGDIALVIEDGH